MIFFTFDSFIAVRCQVTAMVLHAGLLYIGTTWGSVIVADVSQAMCPVTAFRPHYEEVRLMISIPTTTPLNVAERANKDTRQSSSQTAGGSKSSQDSASQISLESPIPKTSFPQAHPAEPVPLLVTVGRGYRPLVSRFLLNWRGDTEHLEQLTRQYFACIWRQNDWAL